MKTRNVSPQDLEDFLRYAFAYLLWLVNSVVCIAAVFQLRSTTNAIWLLLGGDKYSLGLVTQLSTVLGGIAAFIYVMWLESSYRESIAPRAPDLPPRRPARWLARVGVDVLLRRFAITTAIPLGLYVVLLILYEMAWRVVR
ncbi:MAG: hypothetical protein AB1817_01235 [Chloroflexota bacterium]